MWSAARSRLFGEHEPNLLLYNCLLHSERGERTARRTETRAAQKSPFCSKNKNKIYLNYLLVKNHWP